MRRLAGVAAAAATAMLALAACGPTSATGVAGSAGNVAAGTSTTTSRPPATTRRRPTAAGRPDRGPVAGGAACRPGDLRADQTPLSEGAGQFYLAWSITNAGDGECTIPAGRPSVAFDDDAGRPVIAYRETAMPGGSPGPLVLARGASAWFLTDEGADTGCTGAASVSGGPFHFVVTLPGGVRVAWHPGYLDKGSLAGYCSQVPIAISGLEGAKPAAP